MSSASQIQVRRVRESTNGTLPAGNMTIVPFETFQLSSPIQREQPGNVVSDRQVTDNPATDIEISGSAAADFLYGDYDGLIEEAFCNTFAAAYSTTATTIAAVASGNKLTNPAGWSGLNAGDVILVDGFSTNPALFVALVSAVSGNDLSLSWPTLQDEAAGASITVSHDGQLKLGTSMLTASYEEWNVASEKGKKYLGVGVSQFSLTVPHPNRCRLGFQFRGFKKQERISAQLVNGTTAATGNPVINSNTNFGDSATTNSNMGFRYNGTLLANVRIQNLGVTLDSPILTAGGAGTLGPQDISLDGRLGLRIELAVYRTGTDVDTLIDDANDQSVEKSIGVGFKDNSGNRYYLWLAKTQPMGESTTGVAQSGREMANMSFLGKKDSTHTMIRLARFAA